MGILPENYFLPNVILTVMGVLCKEKILFENITFHNRGGGTGSIRIWKITKIGYESVLGFIRLKEKINKFAAEYGGDTDRGAKQTGIRMLVLVILAGMAFIVVMQSSNTIWHMGDSYTDSSVFKYVAYEMLHGKMPYRDTFDHKGPLVYWLNMLGIMIDYWRGIWVIEWIVMSVAIIFMYRCARIYCERPLALAAVFVVTGCIFKYYEWGNLVEEYALPFIAMSTYIFLDFFQNHKKNYFRIAVCGICFAAVCLLRPNMAVLWPIMCVGVMLRLLFHGQKKELLPCAAFFFAGALIVLLPTLFWLLKNDSYAAFIQAYWKYNVLYSNVLGSVNTRKIAMIHFLKDPMVLSSAAVIMFFCVWKRKAVDFLYLAYFILTVCLIALSGNQYMHYGMILVPLMIYPISQLLGYLQDSSIRGKTAGTIGVCLSGMILVKSAWWNAFPNTISQYRDIGKNFISPVVKELSDIVRENSSENDEITVCGNWNEVYLLSERLSASRYSYQTVCSISQKMEEEYFDDLKENPPEIIVLRNDFYAMEKMIKYLEIESYEDIGGDDQGVARVLKRRYAE